MPRQAPFLALACCLLWLAGCSTYPAGKDQTPHPLHKAERALPEPELLDVWIERFDPGTLPTDEQKARGLSPEIREAESRYIPFQLRTTSVTSSPAASRIWQAMARLRDSRPMATICMLL